MFEYLKKLIENGSNIHPKRHLLPEKNLVNNYQKRIIKTSTISVASLGVILSSFAISSLLSKAEAHCTAYHPHHCIRDVKDSVTLKTYKFKITNKTGRYVSYSIDGKRFVRLRNRYTRTHKVRSNSRPVIGFNVYFSRYSVIRRYSLSNGGRYEFTLRDDPNSYKLVSY